MAEDYCISSVCFFPLVDSAPKIFGFSEFLASLALMVLVWTIADFRYRFRIQTAPIPLRMITFIVITLVGFLTLLSDLWRAEGWYVPRGNLFTTSTWQVFLGFIFLFTFLMCSWFAFIRPALYSRLNAKRFAQAVYSSVLKGSHDELAILADEIAHSADNIISNAIDFKNNRQHPAKTDAVIPKPVEQFANDILQLMADKKLCRAIIASSPGTALAIFDAINLTKKYGVPVQIFSKNILNEAITNTDSFLYHETDAYETGLIGHFKPLSQAMFSNYKMVETIGTVLDPDIYSYRDWSSQNWKAYSRSVLMTLEGYVNTKRWNHSFSIYRALSNIESSVHGLYQINETAPESAWKSDEIQKLTNAVDFIAKAIEILNKVEFPKYYPLRVRERHSISKSLHDYIANLIVEIIFHASSIKSPRSLCWDIQHNNVWGKLFNFRRSEGYAGKVIKFKVRRIIYDEVRRMDKFPNFKGAKILGFCLNVMGLKLKKEKYFIDQIALQKVLLHWIENNFAWIYLYNPRIINASLVEDFSYNNEKLQIIHTVYVSGLKSEERITTFNVLPPSEKQKEQLSSSE